MNAETLQEAYKTTIEACKGTRNCIFLITVKLFIIVSFKFLAYMFKIDFPALNKQAFSNELNQKVLREMCCEARQRVWKDEPDHTFTVKGKEFKKPPPSSSSTNAVSRKRKVQSDAINNTTQVMSSNSNSSISSNNSNKSTYVDTISALKFDFQPISTVNQINTVSEMINNSNTNNNLLLNLAHIDSFIKNSVEFDDEATSDMS